MADQPRYRLILRALPGTVPPIHRLRSAPKQLLRGYGMRAERVEQLPAEGPQGDAKDVAEDQSAPGDGEPG